MSIYEDSKTFRNGGNVTRFHTTPSVKQNVAQHSFNCAGLASFICNEYNEKQNGDSDDLNTHQIIMHLLVHDIAEQGTGDMPGGTKGKYPQMRAMMNTIESEWISNNLPNVSFDFAAFRLTNKEETLCKFIDVYECAMTVDEQIYNINIDKNIKRMWHNCIECCSSLASSFKESDTVLYDILKSLVLKISPYSFTKL